MDPRQVIRKELQRRLEVAGFEPRRGDRHAGRLLDACSHRGAEKLPERVAAQWKRTWSLRDLLESWRNKSGLGGVIGISEDQKIRLLGELQEWIFTRFGNIDTPFVSNEEFLLQGARWTAP